MNENSREQISALMDDELEQGSMFIINALKDNREYRLTWDRFHLIGEAMRGQLPETVDMSLADRISKALDNEPALTATHSGPARSLNPFLKPLAGLAIAASVTFVAIVGIRQVAMTPGSVNVVPENNNVVASNQVDPDTYTFTSSAPPAQTVSATAQPYSNSLSAQNRLNRYLVNYNEYRTSTGVQGMLPYVRLVAHDVQE